MLHLDLERRGPLPRIVRAIVAVLCAATAGALLLAGASPPAPALTIDFGGLDHGEILDGNVGLGPGGVLASVATVNEGGGPDIAIIFDSAERGTADDDLEGPDDSGAGSWAGGNLAPDSFLGNLLIISENDADDDGDGRIDDPDDEGSKPAGSIHLAFDRAFTGFGFDLVDIEDNSETMGSIEFLFGGTPVGEIGFEDLVGVQPDIEFGNNTANRIQPFDTNDVLQVAEFDGVIFRLGGSGAFANLTFELTPIPEPGTAMLIGMGVAALTGIRARWRRAPGPRPR